MIDNFEEVKRQLKELADVINTYKSEAVQLRIVEIVLGNKAAASSKNDEEDDSNVDVLPKKKRQKSRKKATIKTETDKKKPAAAGTGPVATLVRLADGDFFETPQSMKSIIEHCEVNLARKIKQTDISGKLARMVREGVLKRAKNADGQYEYSKS